MLTMASDAVYTSPVTKKNRVFKIDDDTYEKLTDISRHFGMKRAAVVRLLIRERFAAYRRTGDL